MMHIHLKDYPVYPLYDAMLIHAGHTLPQIQWLAENGTLYRHLRHHSTFESGLDQFFVPYEYGLQEIFLQAGLYCFVSYQPEFRNDFDHLSVSSPVPEVRRRYTTFDALLEHEHEQVSSLIGIYKAQTHKTADEIDPPICALWHWSQYPPALFSHDEVSMLDERRNA